RVPPRNPPRHPPQTRQHRVSHSTVIRLHRVSRTGTRVHLYVILRISNTQRTVSLPPPEEVRMATVSKSERVPTPMQATFNAIVALTDAFSCPAHAQQCRELLKCVGSRLRGG